MLSRCFALCRFVRCVPSLLRRRLCNLAATLTADAEVYARQVNQTPRGSAPLTVFALNDQQTVFVVNDVLEQAQADFIHLALGKPLTERWLPNKPGRACIADILQKLEQA